MTRLELLELIADKVQELRDLERAALRTSDPRRVLDQLNDTRAEIDDLLYERRTKG